MGVWYFLEISRLKFTEKIFYLSVLFVSKSFNNLSLSVFTVTITVSAVELWNRIIKQLKDMLLKDLSNKIKTDGSNFHLKS